MIGMKVTEQVQDERCMRRRMEVFVILLLILLLIPATEPKNRAQELSAPKSDGQGVGATQLSGRSSESAESNTNSRFQMVQL